MRAVIVGAGPISLITTAMLLKRGHEVVMVERDRVRIEELSQQLACGFVHGDGSTPAILRETDPEETDFLFCLTGNDQTNIIASLVGRSLGFKRVITRIEDPEFEHVCIELGLEDTIIPSLTTGRFLADKLEGLDLLELSGMIRDEARVFSFVAQAADAGPVAGLELPQESRVICYYRDGRFAMADSDSILREGDETVVLTHSRNLRQLQERWAAPEHQNPGGDAGQGRDLR